MRDVTENYKHSLYRISDVMYATAIHSSIIGIEKEYLEMLRKLRKCVDNGEIKLVSMR